MRTLMILNALLLCSLVAGPAVGRLAPGLEAQLDVLPQEAVVRVLVVLEEQADVKALDRQLRTGRATLPDRHRTVVGALQRVAARSQGLLLDDLRAARARDGVKGFTPHWLINSVVVTGTVEEIRRLADRADVATVEPDLVAELIEPYRTAGGPPKLNLGIAPGVQAIGAPRVWRELGIDGSGVIVGNLDTGVDGQHPALADRWRGHFAPASECWLDAAVLGDATPVDRHYHGTHTMGTLTGQAAGDTIGVAPGALWIASNILNYPGSYDEGFDNGVIASLEFMVDPDGDPQTTAEVPAVVLNSWGVHEGISGYFDCDSRWWDALDNCEAAGVVLVWVAGNEGPDASTIRSPGDRASTATSGFCVGSTSHDNPFTISSTSSRGPSACGGEFATKPEVVAPGEDTYSAFPDSNYGYLSGTSMAAPHVAGVVALMRQANPDIDVVTIKEILMSTAADLGPTGEDNTYGHGLVDAYSAVLAVLSGWGTLQGTVAEGLSGQPIAGATVATSDGLKSTVTDQDGCYRLTVPCGESEMVAESFGYFEQSLIVSVPENGTATADFLLDLRPSSLVSGWITSDLGEKLQGATVTALGTPAAPAQTDSAGYYELELPAGMGATYDLLAENPGNGYAVSAVTLSGNEQVDFQLANYAVENFESGDLNTYPWVLQGDAAWGITGGEVYEGAFSVQSGAISNLQVCELSLGLEVPQDCFLDFRFKVSSEAGGDYLILLIDGLVKDYWSGILPWTEYRRLVRAGPHTLTWAYVKNASISRGADCAWLDLIGLPLPVRPPQPDITVDLQEITAVLAPAGATTKQLTAGNAGELDLDFYIKLEELAEPAKADGLDPPLAPGWVWVQPESGIIEPQDAWPIDVFFDATGLEDGLYYAELDIASNDPDAPSVILPVTLTVSTTTPAAEDLPGYRLALLGAAPNPFNPATEIRFTLPAAQVVELAVYDVSGRLVRTLQDGRLNAGLHAVTWDGRDRGGRPVASGTYFALLQTGGQRLVKALVLVK